VEEKKPERAPIIVKDDVKFEEQLKHQLYMFRQSWNMGDIPAVSRTGTLWANMLMPIMNEKERKAYMDVPTVKPNLSDFYDDKDRDQVENYSGISNSRKRELLKIQRNYNKNIGLRQWQKRSNLLLEVMRRLGIYLMEAGEENVGSN
jgi:hypothetical protein